MKKRGSLKTLIILILIGVTVLTSVLIEGFVIIKTVDNNNDQVDIIDDSFAQYLVSTGSNIPTIILLLIFPLICLLTKKIIVI